MTHQINKFHRQAVPLKQKPGRMPQRCHYCLSLAQYGESRILLIEGIRTFVHKRHAVRDGEVLAPEETV